MPGLLRRTALAGLLALAGAIGVVAVPGVGIASASAVAAADEPVGGPKLMGAAVTYDLPPGVPKPPRMPAKGFLLADLTTGQILVAKDPHGRFLPASTLKILTALTLLPRLKPTTVYTARTDDEVIDGTRVGIVAGSTYTVHKLFQGLLMSSGNDAANALAHAAGGIPRTVDLMQREANRLGARDTTVGDPSGLDSPGQRTSPYDLALFARAAMHRKDFRTLVATRTTRFPGMFKPDPTGDPGTHRKRTKSFQIQNHNTLLTAYRGAIGIKPGYTEKARWTFVGAARRGAHTYLVSEMSLRQQGWRPTMKMLDWAFAHGSQALPIGHLVTPAELSRRSEATPSAAAAGGASNGNGTGPVASLSPPDRLSSTDRVIGAAGLGAAAAIVIGLGVSSARRRRRLG